MQSATKRRDYRETKRSIGKEGKRVVRGWNPPLKKVSPFKEGQLFIALQM